MVIWSCPPCMSLTKSPHASQKLHLVFKTNVIKRTSIPKTFFLSVNKANWFTWKARVDPSTMQCSTRMSRFIHGQVTCIVFFKCPTSRITFSERFAPVLVEWSLKWGEAGGLPLYWGFLIFLGGGGHSPEVPILWM